MTRARDDRLLSRGGNLATGPRQRRRIALLLLISANSNAHPSARCITCWPSDYSNCSGDQPRSCKFKPGRQSNEPPADTEEQSPWSELASLAALASGQFSPADRFAAVATKRPKLSVCRSFNLKAFLFQTLLFARSPHLHICKCVSVGPRPARVQLGRWLSEPAQSFHILIYRESQNSRDEVSLASSSTTKRTIDWREKQSRSMMDFISRSLKFVDTTTAAPTITQN